MQSYAIILNAITNVEAQNSNIEGLFDGLITDSGYVDTNSRFIHLSFLFLFKLNTQFANVRQMTIHFIVIQSEDVKFAFSLKDSKVSTKPNFLFLQQDCLIKSKFFIMNFLQTQKNIKTAVENLLIPLNEMDNIDEILQIRRMAQPRADLRRGVVMEVITPS